jgi:hypothetical protein
MEYTYEQRIKWFIENYYESGMEYEGLLVSMKDTDLNSFQWYGETISIPKYGFTKPTLETLEELAKDFYSDDDEMMLRIAFKRGYTECEEILYSEEEVLEQLNILMSLPSSTLDKFTDEKNNITMKWFKKFKKK